MKYYNFFNIPCWKDYQRDLLSYYYGNNDYDHSETDPTAGNFMKILRKEKLHKIVPNMVDYFDDADLNISFLMILGLPYSVTDPLIELHKDHSPVNNMFYMGNYAINISLENTENSRLVFFDENKNEVIRVNYDNCPILIRTNVYHSIIDDSDKLRITATIRFDENANLEKYFN